MSKKRLGHHGGRRIAPDDNRSPMRRLLEDGLTTDRVEVMYDQQWRTFFRAVKQGLIEEDGSITDVGRTFLESNRK